MTRIEDQLRAMFEADAQTIQNADLRPSATFPPPRRRAIGWWPASAAVAAAAAATVAILVGPHLLRAPAQSTLSHPPAAAATAPLSVTFSYRTRTVSPPGVAVSVPEAHVRASDPQVATRVSTVIGQSVDSFLTEFQNQVLDVVARRKTPGPVAERITVADTVAWRHYLSVRFDTSTTVEQGQPANESLALTFDSTTGARVLPTDLFTDITQATATVRAALLASRTDGSLNGYDLAALSLRPSEAGTTTPLNCYPTPDGLHCLVDQGSLAPYEVGRIEATVAWSRLTTLLRPGVDG